MKYLFAACLMLSPLMSRADQADFKDQQRRMEARDLYQRAQVHYRTGELDKAATEFKDSYERFPAPETLFNLAQTHRLLKNYEKAIFFYRQFLSTAQPSAADRDVVLGHIAEMEKLAAARPRPDAPAPTKVELTPAPAPQLLTVPVAASTDKPVYKKAWFWGVIAGGIVVIAAGVTLGVVFGSSTKNPTPSMGIANAMGL